jgi:hypothetical protein
MPTSAVAGWASGATVDAHCKLLIWHSFGCLSRSSMEGAAKTNSGRDGSASHRKYGRHRPGP